MVQFKSPETTIISGFVFVRVVFSGVQREAVYPEQDIGSYFFSARRCFRFNMFNGVIKLF